MSTANRIFIVAAGGRFLQASQYLPPMTKDMSTYTWTKDSALATRFVANGMIGYFDAVAWQRFLFKNFPGVIRQVSVLEIGQSETVKPPKGGR